MPFLPAQCAQTNLNRVLAGNRNGWLYKGCYNACPMEEKPKPAATHDAGGDEIVCCYSCGVAAHPGLGFQVFAVGIQPARSFIQIIFRLSASRTEQCFALCGDCARRLMSIPRFAPLRLLIAPILCSSMLLIGITLAKTLSPTIAVLSALGIYSAMWIWLILFERVQDRQSRNMMAKLYSLLELDESNRISDVAQQMIYDDEEKPKSKIANPHFSPR